MGPKLIQVWIIWVIVIFMSCFLVTKDDFVDTQFVLKSIKNERPLKQAFNEHKLLKLLKLSLKKEIVHLRFTGWNCLTCLYPLHSCVVCSHSWFDWLLQGDRGPPGPAGPPGTKGCAGARGEKVHYCLILLRGNNNAEDGKMLPTERF